MAVNYYITRLGSVTCLVVLAALFAACGSSTNTRDGALPSQTPAETSAQPGDSTQSLSTQYDYFPPAAGESLRKMVEAHPLIIVGRVMDQTGTYYPQEYVPYTSYDVEVVSVISGAGTSPGEQISLLVYGGPVPSRSAVPLWGPVKVGEKYLLFLRDERPLHPGFMGSGFARFELTVDDLIIPNGAEEYPAVAAIVGATPEEVNAAFESPTPDEAVRALARVTLDEATAKILAAIAEAPLPESSLSSSATPTLTATPAPAPSTAEAEPAASPAPPASSP